jgi:hypothetical protein
MDQLAISLIEGIHEPRFLILGAPEEASAVKHRWDHLDGLSRHDQGETVLRLS